MIRRFFWNIRTAFMGQKLIGVSAKQFLLFPVGVGVPIYWISVLQSGSVYYDEYDGDVEEVQYRKRQPAH